MNEHEDDMDLLDQYQNNKNEEDGTEEVEPDAWSVTNFGAVDYDYMSNTSFKSSTFPIYPDEAEPLFSGDKINNELRFEEHAREIEHVARKLEAAVQGTVNREEILELIEDVHDKADDVAELVEVFQQQ